MIMTAPSAFAVQTDQIRGEVVKVDASKRDLTIKIMEVGAKLEAESGTTTTYHVPADVPIEFEIDTVGYRTPSMFDFGDIRSGDNVLLDFDSLSNWTEVSHVSNIEPKDPAVRERIASTGEAIDSESDMNETAAAEEADMSEDAETDLYAYNELPATASALPLVAMFGLVFAGLALALRRTHS